MTKMEGQIEELETKEAMLIQNLQQTLDDHRKLIELSKTGS